MMKSLNELKKNSIITSAATNRELWKIEIRHQRSPIGSELQGPPPKDENAKYENRKDDKYRDLGNRASDYVTLGQGKEQDEQANGDHSPAYSVQCRFQAEMELARAWWSRLWDYEDDDDLYDSCENRQDPEDSFPSSPPANQTGQEVSKDGSQRCSRTVACKA